jgi:hypothetical protein
MFYFLICIFIYFIIIQYYHTYKYLIFTSTFIILNILYPTITHTLFLLPKIQYCVIYYFLFFSCCIIYILYIIINLLRILFLYICLYMVLTFSCLEFFYFGLLSLNYPLISPYKSLSIYVCHPSVLFIFCCVSKLIYNTIYSHILSILNI